MMMFGSEPDEKRTSNLKPYFGLILNNLYKNWLNCVLCVYAYNGQAAC